MKKLFNIDLLATWKKDEFVYIVVESQEAIDLEILMRDHQLELFETFDGIKKIHNKVITQFNLTIYQLKACNKKSDNYIKVIDTVNVIEIAV